jgi:hypothetical protein
MSPSMDEVSLEVDVYVHVCTHMVLEVSLFK